MDQQLYTMKGQSLSILFIAVYRTFTKKLVFYLKKQKKNLWQSLTPRVESDEWDYSKENNLKRHVHILLNDFFLFSYMIGGENHVVNHP